MFAAQSSPQRQIGSPQSNYSSCFQMQICVIKSTKQLKMQIERFRAARLASVGRKKEIKHFHQSLAARFFSAESTENRFVCFCLRIRFPKSSQGNGALLAAWEFNMRLVSETVPFSVGWSRPPSLQCVKRCWKRGRDVSQNGGIIPGASVLSAPLWRLVCKPRSNIWQVLMVDVLEFT